MMIFTPMASKLVCCRGMFQLRERIARTLREEFILEQLLVGSD